MLQERLCLMERVFLSIIQFLPRNFIKFQIFPKILFATHRQLRHKEHILRNSSYASVWLFHPDERFDISLTWQFEATPYFDVSSVKHSFLACIFFKPSKYSFTLWLSDPAARFLKPSVLTLSILSIQYGKCENDCRFVTS